MFRQPLFESTNARMRRLLESDTGPKLRGPRMTQLGRSMPVDADTASTHRMLPESWPPRPTDYPETVYASSSLPVVFVAGRGDVIPRSELRWMDDEGTC